MSKVNSKLNPKTYEMTLKITVSLFNVFSSRGRSSSTSKCRKRKKDKIVSKRSPYLLFSVSKISIYSILVVKNNDLPTIIHLVNSKSSNQGNGNLRMYHLTNVTSRIKK